MSHCRRACAARRFRSTLAALIVASCALLAAPERATANDQDIFGFGARQNGMGGAVTAFANDYTATYYNPAGLTNSPSLKIAAGYSFAEYFLSFDSQRGGGADRDAERIDDLSAITIGISTRFPIHSDTSRIAFGLGLFIPTKHIVDVASISPTSRPEFVLFGETRDKLGVYPSVAIRVTEWFALGVGASIASDTSGSNVNIVNLTGNAPAQIEFRQEVVTDAAPIVGLLFEPLSDLSFGLTYRGELSLKVEFESITVTQDVGISIPLKLESITLFSPHQVAIGVAWDPTETLTLALDLTWLHWSAFDEPFLVASSQVVPTAAQVDPDLDDVVVPRLGVEYQALEWLRLRGGYSYQPSPFPDQEGTTNLIDVDRHVISLGVGFAFGSESAEDDSESVPFDVDLFVQLHLAQPEDVTKDNPNDPIGDYEVSGGIINFGFSTVFRF